MLQFTNLFCSRSLLLIAACLQIVLSGNAHAVDVSFSWSPNPEPVDGYRIHYKTGTSGPPYNGTGATEGSSPVDIGDVTSFTLHGLAEEETYYFSLTAYIGSVESGYAQDVVLYPAGPGGVDTAIVDNDGDGFTEAWGDCDDEDARIHPNAEEICWDGTDNNCNGLTDEDCNVSCPDADGDGYRDPSCGGSDCNDDDRTIRPGAVEICDNIDNNCDGRIDENRICTSEFWSLMMPVILNAAEAAQAGRTGVSTTNLQAAPD
jgi:hypothetical protein